MDPGYAVVANASITVTNTRTGGVYDTRTTSAGDYTVPLLPPGVYTVTVEAPGFEKYVGTGTEVTVNNLSRVDVKLTVGAVTQSVTVDATAPLLKSESDEQSTNVNTQEILQLPNEGTGGARNPRSMVILVPGVSGQGRRHQRARQWPDAQYAPALHRRPGYFERQQQRQQHGPAAPGDGARNSRCRRVISPPNTARCRAACLRLRHQERHQPTPWQPVRVSGRITCSMPTSPSSTQCRSITRTISASASAVPSSNPQNLQRQEQDLLLHRF